MSDLTADHRLASYGTLAPGRPNHGQLADLSGSWRQGMVRGRRVQAGWGAWVGYPGCILDPEGDEVEVFIFESPDLPAHWARLDAFEGDAYRRVITTAQTDDGPLDVSIYEIKPE